MAAGTVRRGVLVFSPENRGGSKPAKPAEGGGPPAPEAGADNPAPGGGGELSPPPARGGPAARDAAPPVGDVAVERPRVDDLSAHRGVADREEPQHHPDGQVGDRDADPPGYLPSGGGTTGDDGHRRDCGQGEEHHRWHAQ